MTREAVPGPEDGRGEARPPRLARLLVRLAVPGRVAREGLLGDLREEHAARHRRSPLVARAWYWRAALSLGATYSWDRVHRRVVRRERPPGDHGGGGRSPEARALRTAHEGDSLMRTLAFDLRHAARTLTRSWGFSAIAVVTLALGIGATTAIYGTLEAAMLEALPYEEPDRLVLARTTFGGRVNSTTSGPDYEDYRRAEVFDPLACMAGFTTSATITGLAEPQRAETQRVSWNLFRTLGVDPAVGRHFAPDEGQPGAPGVAVVSHDYWQRSLGGDPDAVGTRLALDGVPHTVVGVMPAGFRFVFDVDIWITYRPGGPYASGRQYHNWVPVGRLAPGVTMERAQRRVDAVSANLQEEYPDTNENKGLLLMSLHEALVEDHRPALLLLGLAAGLVLLIACGNVANLLLARGSAREADMAVRTALGAARGRLVRQLLTESLVLALTAGAVGIVVAVWLQGAILRALPLDSLGISELGLDGSTLLFALVVSIVTSLAFGTVPALRTASGRLTERLAAGGRGGEPRGSARLRSGLVVLQVALSVVLLVSAGLLIRSFSSLVARDPGFRPGDLLTAEIRLPEDEYPPDRRAAFFAEVDERLRAIPGVSAVGLVSQLPVRDPGNNIYVHDARTPVAGPQEADSAYTRVVLPGYFEAMGIPLLAGRDIGPGDTAAAPAVMVVDRAMADRMFPDESALGQRVVVMGAEPAEYEIVGVVGNVRMGGLHSEPFPTMYRSQRQVPVRTMRLAVRLATDSTAVASPLRAAVQQLDPNLPVADLRTMESILADSGSVSQSRVMARTLALFAAVALLLASIGLYGVLAYHVNQRRGEIGVRMALGAGAVSVLRLVLFRGLGLVGLGLVAGMVATRLASRAVELQLYGIGPTDPAIYGAMVALLGAVALGACLIPAWRASRVDPVIAMKAE